MNNQTNTFKINYMGRDEIFSVDTKIDTSEIILAVSAWELKNEKREITIIPANMPEQPSFGKIPVCVRRRTEKTIQQCIDLAIDQINPNLVTIRDKYSENHKTITMEASDVNPTLLPVKNPLVEKALQPLSKMLSETTRHRHDLPRIAAKHLGKYKHEVLFYNSSKAFLCEVYEEKTTKPEPLTMTERMLYEVFQKCQELDLKTRTKQKTGAIPHFTVFQDIWKHHWSDYEIAKHHKKWPRKTIESRRKAIEKILGNKKIIFYAYDDGAQRNFDRQMQAGRDRHAKINPHNLLD